MKNMAFCGWTSEHYKDHFEDGKLLVIELGLAIGFSPFCVFDSGIYVCSKCGNELFHSVNKFEHSTAWPAFTQTISSDSVVKEKESKYALRVYCAKCRQRLGHEFLNDGPKAGESRF